MSRLRTLAKSTLIHACRFAGVNNLLRQLHRARLLVLCYHAVVSTENSADPFCFGNVIACERFTEQMEIVARVCRPISLSELLEWTEGKRDLPHHAILITFDDGYRNNLTQAAPVLQRLGIPAIFCVSTGYIGRDRMLWHNEMYRRVVRWPKPFLPMPGGESDRRIEGDLRERLLLADLVRQRCKKLPFVDTLRYLDLLREYDVALLEDEEREMFAFLSWDEVRKLKAMGFEIGSHTVEHPMLTRLESLRLEAELRESKAAIERALGCECSCIAYPNGTVADFSDAVLQAARRIGYKTGFTVVSRFCSREDDALQLGRICITDKLDASEFHTRLSGLYTLWHRMH